MVGLGMMTEKREKSENSVRLEKKKLGVVCRFEGEREENAQVNVEFTYVWVTAAELYSFEYDMSSFCSMCRGTVSVA